MKKDCSGRPDNERLVFSVLQSIFSIRPASVCTYASCHGFVVKVILHAVGYYNLS
jgi:hypothetical protein